MRRSEEPDGVMARLDEPRKLEASSDQNRIRLSELAMPGDARMTTVRAAATPLAGAQVRELISPLPGGLEPLNPALAVTATPDGPALVGESERRSTFPWFEHQNLRDDRAEAFTSVIRAGVYEYSYLARATTLGHFAAPPPKVEEMYHPETFGRGASDRVVVEELVDIPRRSKP